MTIYEFLNGNADGGAMLQKLLDFFITLVWNNMLANPQFWMVIGIGVIIWFLGSIGGTEREYRYARY